MFDKDNHATFERPDWRYWFDFWFFPLVAAMAAIVYADGPAWFAGVAAGFVLWTFVEYWMHRSVLHTFYYKKHGTHLHHHQHPESFVIFPVWQMPLFYAACWLVMPSWLWVGFMLGFVWFSVLHHWLHHWVEPWEEALAVPFGTSYTPEQWKLLDGREPWPWLRRYARWHDVHHKETYGNYGITTTVWDRAFGTYKEAP